MEEGGRDDSQWIEPTWIGEQDIDVFSPGEQQSSIHVPKHKQAILLGLVSTDLG